MTTHHFTADAIDIAAPEVTEPYFGDLGPLAVDRVLFRDIGGGPRLVFKDSALTFVDIPANCECCGAHLHCGFHITHEEGGTTPRDILVLIDAEDMEPWVGGDPYNHIDLLAAGVELTQVNNCLWERILPNGGNADETYAVQVIAGLVDGSNSGWIVSYQASKAGEWAAEWNAVWNSGSSAAFDGTFPRTVDWIFELVNPPLGAPVKGARLLDTAGTEGAVFPLPPFA